MQTIKIGDTIHQSDEICHSCSMELIYGSPGTNVDGTANAHYCQYCYNDGSFNGGTDESAMKQMIEICIPYKLQAGVYPDAETARKAMEEYFPTLKRWKK